jgi:4'-phosphopantetheinyl transferase
MIWIETQDTIAEKLPAAWLMTTSQQPETQAERALLRRDQARQIVARQLGLPLTSIEIAHDKAGRPMIAPQYKLHLSYATRGEIVLVAMAQQPLGCDIEIADDGEIPWNILTESEQNYLKTMSGETQRLAFTQIWAAKEAAGKCLGVGLSPEIERASVQLIDSGLWKMRASGYPVIHIHTRQVTKNGQRLALAVAMRAA